MATPERASEPHRPYAVARLDDIETWADGRFRYRPVRHHFDITSFGVTAWVGAEGDALINAFDDGSEPAEELFLVVGGRAVFEIEGERVEAGPGTLVFAGPGTLRTAAAVAPSTTVLAIDGSPGRAYDATGWEVWAPLRPLYDAGDHAALVARLETVAAAHPQYPMLAYNLACCESLRGRPAEAIGHLRHAIRGAERLRAEARADADFDPIRGDPQFQALVHDSD